MINEVLEYLKKNKVLTCFLVAILTSIVTMNLIHVGFNTMLGISIMEIAALIYYIFARVDIFNPFAIYSISWLGCVGLANLRMSYYQQNWNAFVWFNILSAYVFFGLGYFIVYKRMQNTKGKGIFSNITKLFKVNKKDYQGDFNIDKDKLYKAIMIFTMLGVLTFILEVLKLKMIPIFSRQMSAYKDFHVSGIHYFTVGIAIIPSLTIIYKAIGGKKKIWIWNLLAFAIPALILSRQLILFEVIVAIVTYNYAYKKISPIKLVLVLILIVIGFSFASVFRHQGKEYIYGVVNFKYSQQSILIQPYVYFAMGFENLRNLIDKCSHFQYGINTLFPIFAFTNTKALLGEQANYTINNIFTVSTYLYDIYLDFGVVGVVVITFVLGGVFSYLYHKIVLFTNGKGVNIAIYSIFTYAILFSFFTNWYSNPSVVFDIIVLGVIAWYTKIKKVNIIEKN